MEKFNNKLSLKDERKMLRNNPTEAEKLLWLNLRGKKLNGRKFRRQHSFGNYIMDFYCPEERLAVELDGRHHYAPEGRKTDAERDAFLFRFGIKVIRFENKEVLEDMRKVLQMIKDNLKVC
jgi:very-short-patch-repair endonuclease